MVMTVLGMKGVLVHFAPAILHSSTGDVGPKGRAAVGDGRCVAVGCDGEAQSELTRAKVDTK
jgi:hypothetical protein